MTGLPTITAEGTLVGDPELRFTPSGIAVAKWRIACNERRFDKDKGEWVTASTTFLTGSCWRTLAENVTESLRRGDLVLVTGTLAQREWEADDGTKRSAYEINADTMGPALTFATATVTKADRRTAATPPADDPWAGGDDEPPF